MDVIQVVLCNPVRTPIGTYNGSLKNIPEGLSALANRQQRTFFICSSMAVQPGGPRHARMVVVPMKTQGMFN
jgi:hypothetical protein